LAPAILEWNSATFERSRWGRELAGEGDELSAIGLAFRPGKQPHRAALRLFSNERKAFADFVARAGGRKKAFVEKELARGKPGEVRLTANFWG